MRPFSLSGPEDFAAAFLLRRVLRVRPLFLRTVSRPAVRTSNCLNPTEAKGVARKRGVVWPAVPLAIFSLLSNLHLARAELFSRGDIHDRPAKPCIGCLRGNSGAARGLTSRVGHSHSPALARYVPRTSCVSLCRGWFSSRTLPRHLGKMADSASGSSRIIDSGIPVSCV